MHNDGVVTLVSIVVTDQKVYSITPAAVSDSVADSEGSCNPEVATVV